MKLKKSNAARIGLISLIVACGANAGWVFTSNGDIPAGTLVSGYEANGEPLYQCRAEYNGGVHPGKIRPSFGGCAIAWGGKRFYITRYETYVIWEKSANGNIPPNALVTGFDSDRVALFTCRGQYKGGLHSGKLRTVFGACNITWGGQRIKVNPYEVLIQ